MTAAKFDVNEIIAVIGPALAAKYDMTCSVRGNRVVITDKKGRVCGYVEIINSQVVVERMAIGAKTLLGALVRDDIKAMLSAERAR